MDRNLTVRKGNILFAELSFNYDTQVSGSVAITIYGYESLEHGLTAAIPLVNYTVAFEHPLLSSLEGVEAFDRQLLKAQPAPPHPKQLPNIVVIDYDDSMSLEYPAMHYRYVFNGPFAGIADIYVDMVENTKTLKFISGRSISADGSASTDSFETNLNFCIEFANKVLNDSPTEFLKVGAQLD